MPSALRRALLPLLCLTALAAGCELAVEALPDARPPRITLAAPGDSTRFVGDPALAIAGRAIDDRGVARITYERGAAEPELPITLGRAVEFVLYADVRELGDSVVFHAYDGEGNRASAVLRVPEYDTVPPLLVLESPVEPLPWSPGAVRLAGMATDAAGVDSVVAWQSWQSGLRRIAVLSPAFDTIVELVGSSGLIPVSLIAYDRSGNASPPAAADVPIDRRRPVLRALLLPVIAREADVVVQLDLHDAHSGPLGLRQAVDGDTLPLSAIPGSLVAVPDSGILRQASAVPAAPGDLAVLGYDSVGNHATATLQWALAPAAGDLAAWPGSFACILAAEDGTAYCWDEPSTSGDGMASPSPVPVPGGRSFTALAAGARHVCGIDRVGAAFCWGDNSDGQLGDGTTTSRDVPAPVAGGLVFRHISAGRSRTCGIDAGGTAHCWGLLPREGGEDVTWVSVTTPQPTPAPESLRTVRVGLAADHTCAVAESGAGYCWGRRAGYLAGAVGVDTVAVRVLPDDALADIHPMGEWWSPWALALSAAGAPLARGTDVPARVGSLGDGPFERLLTSTWEACAIPASSGAPVCTADWAAPAAAARAATAVGLDILEHSMGACFITAGRSLYCRR